VPQISRGVYVCLWKYLHYIEKNGFLEALQRAPGLGTALQDLMWLQSAVLNTPTSPEDAPKPSTPGPTMSLRSLLAEMEECAWIVMGHLEELNAPRC
jgi:hypothetical protein